VSRPRKRASVPRDEHRTAPEQSGGMISRFEQAISEPIRQPSTDGIEFARAALRTWPDDNRRRSTRITWHRYPRSEST
jgi:hypothetical protein